MGATSESIEQGSVLSALARKWRVWQHSVPPWASSNIAALPKGAGLQATSA